MDHQNHKHKVLIVDDEPINIFFLEGILTEEGYEVFTAENGAEALQKTPEVSPDVILLDIMMPGLSGLEVLEKLMENPGTAYIPVIMVTAKAEAEDVQLAMSKGATEYIRKPVNETEMLARLQTVVRIKDNEDRLREQLHSKEEFIHMVSHDMRTPLLSVAGLAEMLLSDETNEEHRKILRIIIDSSTFITDYFNKLLNWSNLGAKEIILSKKWIPLKEHLRTTSVIFSLRLAEKKLTLVLDCDEALTIFADESYFQQIINNLLGNAIKYTPEGGSITLQASQEDNTVTVKVRDTGMGISGLTPDELFGSAFHKSTRGTMGEKGTGVGLRVCRIIADAHGFGLTFTSEKGKGTEFIISIPLPE